MTTEKGNYGEVSHCPSQGKCQYWIEKKTFVEKWINFLQHVCILTWVFLYYSLWYLRHNSDIFRFHEIIIQTISYQLLAFQVSLNFFVSLPYLVLYRPESYTPTPGNFFFLISLSIFHNFLLFGKLFKTRKLSVTFQRESYCFRISLHWLIQTMQNNGFHRLTFLCEFSWIYKNNKI